MQAALDHHTTWELMEKPPTPSEFLEEHPIAMKWSSKSIDVVAEKHMDARTLMIEDQDESQEQALVYGCILWWIEQESKRFPTLSSPEQRAEYEKIFRISI
jgi:hypothetical protein